MDLIIKQSAIPVLVEESAFEGVKRTAAKVAEDIYKVTGCRPKILTPREAKEGGIKQYILCAGLGRSEVLDGLVRSGRIDAEALSGKREVYQICMAEDVLSDKDRALLILGSDKRGTIYGLYALSEYIGVSPLWFWGDVKPQPRAAVTLGRDIETLSKEPAVKYRGFFINDEWPCFGTWTTSHFGDFNTEVYEYVFDFLLRMKGNYLWPAMWTAAFPLDGPGSANEELADIYGVVMGYSHHEPCLRASEEWDKVRGPRSIYGNDWNFYTNEEGLLRYWEDSLKRSGGYENMITIGMRGERDSSMLGDSATVEENIHLLKRIITKQHELIRRNVNEDLNRVPRLLALYKEVEAYFYGDEGTEGLKDWEELDGVTCMLCEDNFGHMRTLPEEKMRNRRGGFGMYYHFDYHGDPVSYEWVDSTPLSQTWEQMCMAWEYGIRDVWIVNAGDLKFHEIPLTYFMALACDYEKWGYGNKDSYRQYTREWVRKHFPQADDSRRENIGRAFTEYIDVNAKRRPEALHPGVYHPCHFGETQMMLEKAQELEKLSLENMDSLTAQEKDAYYSMIHFPLTASMNLLKMHLYAGKNALYAKQGKTAANRYGRLVKECIERDRELSGQFGEFAGGKWNGMQLASHIGFTKWNDDDCRYPVIMQLEPVHRPRMTVSRADEEKIAVKDYARKMEINVPDFLYEGEERVVIEVANSGTESFRYRISAGDGTEIPAWLSVTPLEGDVEELQEVELLCHRDLLSANREEVRLLIDDGDTCVAVVVEARGQKEALLKEINPPSMTFLPGRDGIVMEAAHFKRKQDAQKGAFEIMDGYGKYGSAIKVFPSTASFAQGEERPFASWLFVIPEKGEYEVTLVTAPTNSPVNGREVRVSVENGNGEGILLDVVPGDFLAGSKKDERWAEGVLNQERSAAGVMYFEKGLQELRIGALDAGCVLYRIILRRKGAPGKEAYLGPRESWYLK